jgi:rubrerythrin
MEKEGEAFYRQLAAQSPNPGLKKILIMLADDEVKHAETFEIMKKDTPAEMAETRILKYAKNVFEQMREAGAEIKTDVSQIELYKKAQALEVKSENFYRQKALEVETGELRNMFLKIADEEQKHFVLLRNIVELVSRPDLWVENAEFFHLDEY